MYHALVAALIALLLAVTSAAQTSNVDTTDRWAWGENVGWTNWRDADGGAAGCWVGPGFLAGAVWGENIGWIRLGDGSPASGSAYANTTGDDHGVNVHLATGALSGLAWGENVGWIVFDTGHLGANRARFDPCAHVFGGYAWGENIGWIDLGAALGVVHHTADLGFGLPGTGGVTPQLCAFGHTTGGDVFTLLVRDALPLTTMGLYVGLAANPTPFKGGQLVPVPLLLDFILFTDADSALVLPAPGGTGTTGSVVAVIQCAFLDPGAVKGVSLSNALELTILP